MMSTERIYEIEEKDFLGIFQKAWTHGASATIGGFPAGQKAHPVAVIRYEGRLHEVYPAQVEFKEEKGND